MSRSGGAIGVRASIVGSPVQGTERARRVVAIAALLLCAFTSTGRRSIVHASDGGIYVPIAINGSVIRGLPEIEMSRAHGLVDAPFDLELSVDFPDATIRFTLDGKAPGPDHGTIYAGPIRIERTTVLRAVAFRDGFRPSPTLTATYLFLADVVVQSVSPPGYPPTWGIFPEGPFAGNPVPADYAVDTRITLNDPRYRETIQDDLRSIPSLSIVMDPEDLFGVGPGTLGIYSHPLEKGTTIDPETGMVERPWERPASAEWLPPDGGPGFQIDAGIRIAGGWSRKPDGMAKHSFSLRFRREYGAGRLRYPLFEQDGPDTFDSIRLRAGQADTIHYYTAKAQYIHDEWGRETQAAMGWEAARGTWAHLYLNGLYWGLYNVTEELNDAFGADHMGGEEDDWDVIDADPDAGPGGWRADEGEEGAFKALIALKDGSSGGVIDRDTYALAGSFIDLPSYIDTTLIQLYGDNWDWPDNNWTAMRSRVLEGGFRFFIWDFEQILPLRRQGEVCGPCSDKPDVDTCGTRQCGTHVVTDGPAGLHGWLMGSPEYRLAFADRARMHLFEDGALTPTRTAARYAKIAGTVERAMVGESARWGDVAFGERTRNENWFFIRPFLGVTWTLDDHWRPERDRVLREFFPGRSDAVVQQLCAIDLYPPVSSPRIRIAAGDADSRTGFVVTIDRLADGCAGQFGEGTIWYTVDGADPRKAWSDDRPWRGDVHTPGARVYRGPIGVPAGRLTKIVARLRTPDGVWSAAAEVTLGVPRLAVSELMYHPADDPDLEWLEIINLDPITADLSGVEVLEGVTYTFAAGVSLEPGRRLVLARDAGALVRRHPLLRVHGEFDGRLSNSGERITLRAPNGAIIWSAEYDDEDFWPLMPDGLGYSLVLRDPSVPPVNAESWRASDRPGGSPGAPDPVPPFDGRVVINEVLAHSDGPYEDAIELHNPSAAGAVDIGGWFISDDRDQPRKFRIPDGTVLEPGGYASFYESDFRNSAGGPGFAFSADGEEATLYSADASGTPTGYFRRVRFAASRSNVSFGRMVTEGGIDFTALVTPTFGVESPTTREVFREGGGAPNARPKIGPVVINEILVRPLGSSARFVELLNVSDAPVPLGGDEADGTGPWALIGSLSVTFPPGLMIDPGEYVIVTAVEASVFRSLHTVPEGTEVIGPWEGMLGTEGGDITLVAPPFGTTSDIEDGPWVVVDRVRYRTSPPWPGPQAAHGRSLERINALGYGNDPRNWIALRAHGSPGRSNTRPVRIWLPLTIRNR